MPCELCGADAPLSTVPDIYDRMVFRICNTCKQASARTRPLAPDPRIQRRRVGGADTTRPRLPPEIECPICRGSGGDECDDCGGSGGDSESRECSLCEGQGDYACYTCGGRGRRLIRACKTCGGDGRVACEKCGGRGREIVRHLCPRCGGSGHLCSRCGGRKTVKLYS